MGVRVNFDLHGTTPEVWRADRTFWLRIPLTEAPEPALAVFLTPHAAEALLASLRIAVEGYRRLVAAEAEYGSEVVHHRDGNPLNHDVTNLAIRKKEENRHE